MQLLGSKDMLIWDKDYFREYNILIEFVQVALLRPPKLQDLFVMFVDNGGYLRYYSIVFITLLVRVSDENSKKISLPIR